MMLQLTTLKIPHRQTKQIITFRHPIDDAFSFQLKHYNHRMNMRIPSDDTLTYSVLDT